MNKYLSFNKSVSNHLSDTVEQLATSNYSFQRLVGVIKVAEGPSPLKLNIVKLLFDFGIVLAYQSLY